MGKTEILNAIEAFASEMMEYAQGCEERAIYDSIEGVIEELTDLSQAIEQEQA